jgi:hypothetical protein
MYCNQNKIMRQYLYRVYLDRPGCGWEEIVRAHCVKEAISIAREKHLYDFSGPSDIGTQRLPESYFEDLKIQRRNEYRAEVERVAEEYVKTMEGLIKKYAEYL